VARHQPGKGSARESGAPLGSEIEAVDPADDADLADLGDDAGSDEDVEDLDVDDDTSETVGATARSSAVDAFWSEVRIQPVEIALPSGVGYTLRAYRLSTDLAPTEVDPEEDDFDELAGVSPYATHVDDEEALSEEEMAAFEQSFEEGPAHDDEDDPARVADRAETEQSDDVEEDDDEDEEEDDKVEPPPAEDVPAFLSHRGRLLLFRSPEGLAEFVRSPAQHDLTQLDTWPEVRKRITAADVVPSADERYELDLVVENLRGGPDVWDLDLLIQAGELARDAAYALRMKSVVASLAAGSPLDDLDEALRGAANGGIGGFFARRKFRKIGAQQAAIGWRTIIGKISAATDWRD
jgi:hypothetical protein